MKDVWRGEHRDPATVKRQLERDLQRALSTSVRLAAKPEAASAREELRIYDCPLCERDNLRGDQSFWMHVRNTHKPRDIAPRDVIGAADFEEALVAIVNATALPDAIDIATKALLGEPWR